MSFAKPLLGLLLPKADDGNKETNDDIYKQHKIQRHARVNLKQRHTANPNNGNNTSRVGIAGREDNHISHLRYAPTN